MGNQTSNLIGGGLYPLTQAARLTGVEARNVRRWLKGYSWKYFDGRNSSGPLWKLQYADDDELGGEQVLGFHDLLELRAVARFMSQGVSLKTLRATIEQATREFGPYPLHTQRFRTVGQKIFHDAVERSGERKLTDYKAQQVVFDAVIRPSLYAGIDYAPNGTARRWFPVQGRKVIVLDPSVQFGEPIIASAGVPTDTIADAVKAENGDFKRVAKLYRLTPADVQAAVNFERRLAA
jgi:uncharacterized protein (DUF433 family)